MSNYKEYVFKYKTNMPYWYTYTCYADSTENAWLMAMDEMKAYRTLEKIELAKVVEIR